MTKTALTIPAANAQLEPYMKNLSRLASLAALVVGSSIALLTGAQAATTAFLGFGPALSQGFSFLNQYQQPGNLLLVIGNVENGPAFTNNLRDGTFSFPLGVFDTIEMTIGDYEPKFGVFNTVSPNRRTFSASFPDGDSLLGTVNLTQVASANTHHPDLLGIFTVNSVSGDSTFLSSFGPDGRTGEFSLPLNRIEGSDTPTLAELISLEGVSGFASYFPLSTGFITMNPVGEIPLPPAIYLFGSVLGGAFWRPQEAQRS
jgi:hypothetical protein